MEAPSKQTKNSVSSRTQREEAEMWRQVFAARLSEHAQHTADVDWPFAGSRSLAPLLTVFTRVDRDGPVLEGTA